MTQNNWTPEEEQWLRENYRDTPNTEICERFGVTPNSLRNKAKRMALRKSPEMMDCYRKATQFKKGHTPFNKGRKMEEWMSFDGIERSAKGRFKSGDEPFNTRPLYSERIGSKDGYVQIKVPGHNKFVLKHRWVWEQYHGPIPKGMQIHFKDGDRTNCDIDNLEIISAADCARMNSPWNRLPREIASLYQLKGALNRQINKHKKEMK